MKILLPLLVLILIVLYLNRAYAFIYWTIGNKNLSNPNTKVRYFIPKESQQSTKYVALGDSLTAGVGVEEVDKTLPYLIAKKIVKNSPVELVNLGIPGARTADVFDFELEKAVKENPDIITLFVGVNDIHGFVLDALFKKNYENIVSKLTKKTKAKIIILNIPHIGTSRVLLPPYDFVYNLRIQRFNNIIKDLATQKNIQYVDIYSFTKNKFESNNFYSRDEFHPNDKGYKLWSDLVNVDSN